MAAGVVLVGPAAIADEHPQEVELDRHRVRVGHRVERGLGGGSVEPLLRVGGDDFEQLRKRFRVLGSQAQNMAVSVDVAPLTSSV